MRSRRSVDWVVGRPVSVFRVPVWILPMVAVLTIWWTIGFNVLLFLAGLRNIPARALRGGALDGAGRWSSSAAITWPLIWPVTALVLTIQLILQIKVFDQVFLLSSGSRPTMVLVQYVYMWPSSRTGAAMVRPSRLACSSIVMVLSVLQFQLLRARGTE